MAFHSSSGGSFDGLTSFFGRSFSRRAKKLPAWDVVPPVSAEFATARVIHECAVSHRALALELTEAAIDHYLDLTRKLAEAKRQIELQKRTPEQGGPYRRTHIAEDETEALGRWAAVIETALKGAEAEVVAVVRAWEEARVARNDPGKDERGVIHKGRLYLAIPGEGNADMRLSIVDLQSSLNLDGSMTVVNVVAPGRPGEPLRPITIR